MISCLVPDQNYSMKRFTRLNREQASSRPCKNNTFLFLQRVHMPIMDKRTFSYLNGRFRDYYRESEFILPPDASNREWGFIPFSDDGSSYMKRHIGLSEMGGLDSFSQRESPRHFYFSAAKYQTPSAPEMNQKSWTSADLIFDIDADHLSTVNEDTTPYNEMLQSGKQMVQKLYTVLKEDFTFEDVTIVFSGGRGYHIHIRDSEIQNLTRDARNEIVDYLTGTVVEFDTITTDKPFFLPITEHSGQFPKLGGWGNKYRNHILQTFESMHDDFIPIFENNDEETAYNQIATKITETYDITGIGPKRSQALVQILLNEERFSQIKFGNIAVSPVIRNISEQLVSQTIDTYNIEIDEPVTTDINRLIRVPGSLHGGKGLQVKEINPTELETFNPMTDAIPEIFTRNTVNIEVKETVVSQLNGEETTYEQGEHTVPEYEAIHLLCREDAKKLRE